MSIQAKKWPSPPKTGYGVGKGLMTGKGPVFQGVICRLLTHKDHVIEMVNSIIKDHVIEMVNSTEDLVEFSLFDLSRVCSF